MRATRVVSALVGLLLSAAAFTVCAAGPSQADTQNPTNPASVCPATMKWDGSACVSS